MNVGFNLQAKKPRKAIATEEAGRSEIGNLAGDAVSFPEWREAGSLPYSQIASSKIDN